MSGQGSTGAGTLYWITIAVFSATIALLYVQLHRSRSVGDRIKETLVTVESTLEYALEESLKQGILEPADPEASFSVVVILDSRGCAACIVSEVAVLNTHWDRIQERTQIYYGGDTAVYLEGREIRFEYSRLTSVEEVLGIDWGPINPVSLLMADGQILDVRVSTPTNRYHEEVASAWYSGVSTLF